MTSFRKTLCCLAAVLFSLGIIPQAFAQASLTLTPRGEVNYTRSADDDETDFGFTSLYGFLDGSIGEAFSYSASFHFLSTDPKSLYSYDSPFQDGTWIDWAYLSYDNDLFGVDFGKVVLNMGGFEFDKNDVDCYVPMVSDYWNSLCIYQPGVTFRLTPWETHSFEAQLTTSPMMTGLKDVALAASAAWRGEFGAFSTFWAANLQRWDVEDEVSGNYLCVGLGNMYSFENVDLTLDLFYGPACGKFDWGNSEATLRADYRPSDRLSLGLMGACRPSGYVSAGAQVEYFPLRDDTLRFHFAASDRYLNDIPESAGANRHLLVLSLGLTANLHIGL